MKDNIQAFQNLALFNMRSNYTTLDIIKVNDILQTNLLDLSAADFPEYILHHTLTSNQFNTRH
jgi:hypothetical protein